MLSKINLLIDKLSPYSHIILRIGLGFVFIWFGWSSITETEKWIALVPAWAIDILAPANILVIGHGIFEVVFGLLLVFGIFARLTATLLLLNLLHTITLISGPTQIRDIGLAFALLALVVHKK